MSSERQLYRLGPRSSRGLFGYLSGLQAATAGTGAVAAIGLLAAAHSVGAVIAAAVIFAGCAAAAFWPVGNLTVAQWAPVFAVFAAGRVLGRHPWRSPAPGMGVLDAGDGPEYPVAWPPVLDDVEIISVARPGGPVGMMFDRRQQTLCAVLQVRLRAFGLLDDEDQDRRLESFGVLQDDLARAGSDVLRFMLLHRTVPRQTRELAAYVQQHLRQPLTSAPVRALLEVIDAGADLAQEHELFVVVQMPAAVRRRRRRRRAESLQQAGVQAADQLDTIARSLQAAEIAVRSVDGALPPRALSRMIKDAFDPFGRLLRDRLDMLTPASAGLDPAHAGAEATDHYRDRYRTDSADHVTWWIKQYPDVATAGLWQPLTVRSDAPVQTVAVIMEPVPAGQAMRDAKARLTSDQASAASRQKFGQLTTTEHSEREAQSGRIEKELTGGLTSWRFEAFVTGSVPAGNEDEFARMVEQIESGCTRARLHPVRLYGSQDRAFTYTLPLCRGLR